MLIPAGQYCYEIRRGKELIAIEEESFSNETLSGTRRSTDGSNRHEVEAEITPDGLIRSVKVRYSRGPFNRNAAYTATDDSFRGSISALAGRNDVVVKLGRFREVDADLALFRAIIVAHIRARGQMRWTGRVATIDPNTLVAASIKNSCRCDDDAGRLWVYEVRMGDVEEIEVDDEGRLIRKRDSRGVETVLTKFTPAPQL